MQLLIKCIDNLILFHWINLAKNFLIFNMISKCNDQEEAYIMIIKYFHAFIF